MLLKNVHQWDIRNQGDLAIFREESAETHKLVERALYRRSDNITPGKIVEMVRTMRDAKTGQCKKRISRRRKNNTGIPFMSREEFLEQLSTDLSEGFLFEEDKYYRVYNGFNEHHVLGRNIPRGIVVRAVIEHRDGKPIRAEFLEVRGDPLAELPDPKAGKILDCQEDENGNWGYVMEDSDGRLWVDVEFWSRTSPFGEHLTTAEDARQESDAVKRLSWRDLDDRDESMMHYLVNEVMRLS